MRNKLVGIVTRWEADRAQSQWRARPECDCGWSTLVATEKGNLPPSNLARAASPRPRSVRDARLSGRTSRAQPALRHGHLYWRTARPRSMHGEATRVDDLGGLVGNLLVVREK